MRNDNTGTRIVDASPHPVCSKFEHRKLPGWLGRCLPGSTVVGGPKLCHQCPHSALERPPGGCNVNFFHRGSGLRIPAGKVSNDPDGGSDPGSIFLMGSVKVEHGTEAGGASLALSTEASCPSGARRGGRRGSAVLRTPPHNRLARVVGTPLKPVPRPDVSRETLGARRPQ